MSKDRCSLCGKELKFRYELTKYGIQGFLCGNCYAKKLKEIYNIKH